MDDRGFVAALTPAVTDANARERFLADPKAALAALRVPDADLSDRDLEGVVGGIYSNSLALCTIDPSGSGGLSG